jgi:hypothetical protein
LQFERYKSHGFNSLEKVVINIKKYNAAFICANGYKSLIFRLTEYEYERAGICIEFFAYNAGTILKIFY